MTKEEQIDHAWAQHLAQSWPVSAMVTLSKLKRWTLAEAQNWRCCWCGIRMEGNGIDWDAPTFEHVVPRSKGGLDELDNLVIACRQCNGLRGNGETP
jgi:hypothetical protein